MKKLEVYMKRFYFSILLLFVTNTYYSQWSTNPNENLQVAVHGGNIHAVPDGKGGAILTFNNFDYDVVTTYLQSVDRYGYLKWTEPKIIADGPGPKNYGVGLFSSDDDKYIFGYISGYTYIDSNLIQYAFFDPYIQKIDTNGNKLWGEYGIKLNPNSPSQRVNMFMCNDGNGGIYAFWKISPPPDYSDYDSLFLQHISKAGEKLWGENGIFIGDSIADNYSFWIVNDDSGGVYVQYRKKDTVYCIEKFDSLGTLIWSLITSARFQEVIKDEHSGIIVSGVYFSYPTDKIVINRISSTGVKLWGGGGGIIVDDSVNNSSSALLLLNSDNTISVFWDTNWWPNDDLFLQRFTLDGEQMWEEHLIVTDVVSAKERAGIVESENNSNIVIWSDSRPPGGLFAQQINEFGENVWADSDRVIMYRNVLPDENGIITDVDYV
jgi:hypothetical protein